VFGAAIRVYRLVPGKLPPLVAAWRSGLIRKMLLANGYIHEMFRETQNIVAVGSTFIKRSAAIIQNP
jgi:hypothetical protein